MNEIKVSATVYNIIFINGRDQWKMKVFAKILGLILVKGNFLL